MKKLLYLWVLLPILAVSQDNKSFLLNLTEITVKPGHNTEFVEGVKMWKACYLENEGEDKWNIWQRLQGKGNVYTMTSIMANWAEMDDEAPDDARKACKMIVTKFIMPHVESVQRNIAKSMPEVSMKAPFPDDTKLVWVYNVKINNSTSFMEVVNEISKAIRDTEGDSRGRWYNVIGGDPEVADYFIGVPFSNFADLDVARDGVWKVHEKMHGKSKTDKLRAKFRGAVDSDWTYIYKLKKDLSN